MNEINLEPNYSALLYRFTKDAEIHAHRLEEIGPGTLSAFRNFIVSLNIAAQATVNEEGLLFLRQEIDSLMKHAVAKDNAMQAKLEASKFICPKCGFDCGENWENSGGAEDGVCPRCRYQFEEEFL